MPAAAPSPDAPSPAAFGPAGDRDADVIVVGAGPVGLALANFLGLYGVSVTVVEATSALVDYPRGVGIDDESLRTFQALGLVDEVLPHTTPDHYMRFVNAKGRCYASIEPTSREFGWPRRNAFIQPLADQVLLRGLDRFGHATVVWDRRVEAVGPDRDGVTVSLTGPDGALASLRASYVVGCDGGRSAVRKSMGVTWDGVSSPTRWIVVDVGHDPLGTPNAYLHGDYRRPYVSIALPHNTRRFEFMLLPGEDEEVMSTPERIQAMVERVFPGLGPLDYIRSRVYTHHARVAGAFVRGRVMIAGDAAHLMPVWQGQGYNSGIRDAANLGWKLACVLQGRAGPGILETYGAERRRHAAAMVRVSQTAGLLVRQTRRSTATVRDAVTRLWTLTPPLRRYILEMRYKPMPRYQEGLVLDSRTPQVGRLFPQPLVTTRNGDAVLLDDVLGPWFALLTWTTDPRDHLDEDAAGFWKGLGARLVVVRPMPQLRWAERGDDDVVVVGDQERKIKAWFDRAPGSVVVLRPDRFVAAVARPADLSAVTKRLSALLAAGATTPSATGTPTRTR